MINIESLQERLQQAFGHLQLNCIDNRGMIECEIPALENLNIVQFLNKELGFQFLTDITAVHYPDQEDRALCVVTHLHNLVENTRLRLKAYLPLQQPDTHSLTAIFSGANWMERETYDFYGVNFMGHPDLRRILNVEEMDYFPMRKEYQMEDPTRMDKDDAMFGR
jgi:NADH-quinone oxidoreductase subunit C